MRALIRLLHFLPPEFAHNLAIFWLKNGFLTGSKPFKSDVLQNEVFGVKFRNPVGLSAGFDKNAECLSNLSNVGFGFLEVGTVTLRPQAGNPKPRIFRLKGEEAIINRLGFNNRGIDYLVENILSFKKKSVPIGINIGKNKDSLDPVDDYIQLFKRVSDICDYVVLNISSPNTVGLRELQKSDALSNLLAAIQGVNDKKTPLLIKIAPDVTDEQKTDIVEVAIKHQISGMILTNTTISNKAQNSGGLSGKPLFSLSTRILGEIYKYSRGKIPLIGCGGISNAQDAYIKIKNGASLIQIYTALIYQGFKLVNEINQELEKMLTSDGFVSIKQAIGSDFSCAN